MPRSAKWSLFRRLWRKGRPYRSTKRFTWRLFGDTSHVESYASRGRRIKRSFWKSERQYRKAYVLRDVEEVSATRALDGHLPHKRTELNWKGW